MRGTRCYVAWRTKPKGRLNLLSAPCPESWDEMKGDEQVRFCGKCEQNVYNFSELTEDEALALLRRHEGRVCVGVFQRDDGTSMTKDCPVGKELGMMYMGRPTPPQGWDCW